MKVIIGAVIFSIITMIILQKWMARRVAGTIIVVKFGIPVVLYIVFGDYIHTMNLGMYDSWYQQSQPILADGHTPWSILRENFSPISRSRPFYWWWTILWLTLLEDSITAPVLANAFVTVIGSTVSTLILREVGFSFRYQQWFLAFTLIHWDILTWASLINHREKVMATAYVIVFYCVLKFVQSDQTAIQLATLPPLIIILWVIDLNRDYMIIALFGVIVAWLFLEAILQRKLGYYHALLLPPTLLVGIWSWLEWGEFFLARFSLQQLPYGIFRFALGPTWWDLGPDWYWLIPASMLHWLMVPVVAIGVIKSVRYSQLRLLYVFALIVWLLFAGPVGGGISPQRFRLQLVFILAIAQFHGLWFIFTEKIQIDIRV